MRVLLDVSAVPPKPVGAGVYTIAVARGMGRQHGVDLHLLTRRDDTERWAAIAPDATLHASAPNRRPARLAWEQTTGPGVARRVRPDVWHAPHYTMPLRSATPTVVAMHDLTFFEHPEWHERSKVVYFRRMMAAAARRADLVITGSHDAARALERRLQPKGEIVVIHHGVDHDRFRPDDAAETRAADLAALARHGIAPPYIAFASTIEPRKDVPTLVRAFARIAAEHPGVQLVVAGGDGWGAVAARDAIAACGVATRVLRPGYLDDATLVSFFRRAEVIAYPSLFEGFGMPALEALASGTPLVTTSGSSLDEVVGDAALLFAPGDVDALSRHLATILDDPDVAARLRRAGPARAAAFTWERSIAAHVEAYTRAIRRHEQPSAVA